jgi:hypothetical protein
VLSHDPDGILETVLQRMTWQPSRRSIAATELFAKADGFHRCGRAGREQVLLIFNPIATSVPPVGSLPVPPHGMVGARLRRAAEVDSWRQRLTEMRSHRGGLQWLAGGRSIYFRPPQLPGVRRAGTGSRDSNRSGLAPRRPASVCRKADQQPAAGGEQGADADQGRNAVTLPALRHRLVERSANPGTAARSD